MASPLRTTHLTRREMLLLSAAAVGGSVVSGIAGCSRAAGDRHPGTASHQSNSTSSLPTRHLGPLEVTALGFGAMNLVPGYYGPGVSRADAIKVIQQVFDRGLRFIDTAQVYGPFLSEHYVGEATAPFRNQVVIVSKFGFNLAPGAAVT